MMLNNELANEQNHESNMNANSALPIWEKPTLTIKETSQLFNIGINRVRQVAKQYSDLGFVVKIGTHTLIKRKAFEDFINQSNEL